VEETCENCKFWKATTAKLNNEENQVLGLCRSRPPKIAVKIGMETDWIGDYFNTRWPITLAAECCGEYQPAGAETPHPTTPPVPASQSPPDGG
jgi:hypothetical protein